LILVLPGALAAHVSAVIPGIQYSLGEKQSSSNMKIDTLAFIQVWIPHYKQNRITNFTSPGVIVNLVMHTGTGMFLFTDTYINKISLNYY
jgi:hypothetical protein